MWIELCKGKKAFILQAESEVGILQWGEIREKCAFSYHGKDICKQINAVLENLNSRFSSEEFFNEATIFI